MSRTHGAFALLAALLLPCAQGCRTGAAVPPAALLRQQPPNTSATPEPYAPPFPAQKRGDEAFEPFVSLSGGRVFESREVRRKPVRKDMKVSASYPVLSGDDRPAAREFNRRARSFVLDEVTPYLESDGDAEKEKEPFWKGVEEYHDVYHKVVFASDGLVSTLFYVDSYNWGAAHGIHHPVTLNFDLKAGREIKLAQLFRPGSDYLSRIAALCREDLERQFGRGFPFFTGGLGPKPDNYKSWVVTRGGLVLIFEEYQVVAYADGEPKVLIPFDSLKEIIDPRGPLAALAGNE
jgi:hypothetical protein